MILNKIPQDECFNETFLRVVEFYYVRTSFISISARLTQLISIKSTCLILNFYCKRKILCSGENWRTRITRTV